MPDIESVKEHFTDCINLADSKDNSWVFVMVDKLKDALELLKEQPQWIPVSERLPEEKHGVIVYDKTFMNQFVAYLDGGKWYLFGTADDVPAHEITHWMPLPKWPEEGGK